FGRIPSLTAQIRELIHDYPEGIGIIKELAQNADDAGARVLEIVIDRRSHPTARLPAGAMGAIQGRPCSSTTTRSSRRMILTGFKRSTEAARSARRTRRGSSARGST